MDFKCGKTTLHLDPPDGINWQVLKNDLSFSFQHQNIIIQQGIDELIRLLSSRIRANSRLLLIVPDHTRKCNLPIILSPLLDA